jgi:hypothetical protein
LLLRGLEAVVDDILEHTLNLLDAKGLQQLVQTGHQCHSTRCQEQSVIPSGGQYFPSSGS